VVDRKDTIINISSVAIGIFTITLDITQCYAMSWFFWWKAIILLCRYSHNPIELSDILSRTSFNSTITLGLEIERWEGLWEVKKYERGYRITLW